MKLFSVIFFSFVSVSLFAQDPQFSQYYQAPLYLNPGFTGITSSQRLVFNHRLQWPGIPQAFTTYAASYDRFSESLQSGFGVLFTTDKMGSAGWRSTTLQGMYSYKLKFTETLIFSPGISFGYGINGLDRSKIRMTDGLQYEGVSLDPELNDIQTQNYFDFGSGFVLYSPNLWFGASFMHMNRPNISVVGEESRMAMKTSIHGGVKLRLGNAIRVRTPYFTPSFILRMQGAMFSQLDAGVNFHIDPVSFGVWYRGKPFQKNIINSVEHDAAIFFAGLYLKNLSIGYSYDFTVSKLQTSTGGSHEVSITYEFSGRQKKKKKYKLIPCPAFYNKQLL